MAGSVTIIAPTSDYNGVSAGVRFANGRAEVPEDHRSLWWFEERGYRVERAERSGRRKSKSEPDGGMDG